MSEPLPRPGRVVDKETSDKRTARAPTEQHAKSGTDTAEKTQTRSCVCVCACVRVPVRRACSAPRRYDSTMPVSVDPDDLTDLISRSRSSEAVSESPRLRKRQEA